MKLLKYYLGSLIISFGILLVLTVVLGSMQIKVSEVIINYLALIWALLAVVILPFAKKIIRL